MLHTIRYIPTVLFIHFFFCTTIPTYFLISVAFYTCFYYFFCLALRIPALSPLRARSARSMNSHELAAPQSIHCFYIEDDIKATAYKQTSIAPFTRANPA